MDTRVAWRVVGAVAALFLGMAHGSEPLPTTDNAELAGRAIGKVEEAVQTAYREAIEGFDARQKLAPDDVEIAVARCRFIDHYTDEESGTWMLGAMEEFESCSKQLHERWPDAPQAQIFELDQLWGEEAASKGEALLKSADRWPSLLRRELVLKTSVSHEGSNEIRAGELALMAVRLGDASRLPAAVKYLSGLKKFDEATELLVKAEPTEMPWEAKERIEAALTLPDPKVAIAEVRRHPAASDGFGVEIVARAYMHAGDFAAAQRVLKDAPRESEAMRSVQFDAAMGNRDFANAAQFVSFTDRANFTTNFGRFAKLAVAAPITLVDPSMLLGVAACIAWIVAMALIPGVVLVPAHYRGLARRLKGRVSQPLFPPLGLWRAWYAAAIAIVVPTVAIFLVSPNAMAGLIEGDTTVSPDLFRAFLAAEIAGLLFLVPALTGTNRRQLIGDRATLGAWWTVLMMWAALIGIGYLLAWLLASLGVNGETAQTRMVAAMAEGGAELGGPMLSLLLMAFIAPVFEELVFRGLLLGGLSRHISFGWANTVQALLFAAIHDDPPRFVYYFAMGLFGGWLVKRTGSLGPAIALHVLNNTVAVGLLMSGVK